MRRGTDFKKSEQSGKKENLDHENDLSLFILMLARFLSGLYIGQSIPFG